MQHQTFDKYDGGGGVVHGVTGDFNGRVSAWYNAAGEIVDMEQIILWASRPIKKNGPMWRQVENKIKHLIKPQESGKVE